MSGGVDSSVSALLLQRQGYRVHGVFMDNWDAADEQGAAACSAQQDWLDARAVCDSLGIPISKVSFVKEYWHNVFSEFLEGLERGITPNPDVMCNREIKFKALLQHADRLGADFLATGHYAQLGWPTITGAAASAPAASGLTPPPPPPPPPAAAAAVPGAAGQQQRTLLKAVDADKDQTYFLVGVTATALAKTIFPVGHMPKSEVRRVADEAGLVTAAKRDSVGLCFVGKRPFEPFIEHYLPARPGPVVSALDGSRLGTHRGLHLYTLGQAARLGGADSRYYVCGKEAGSNTLLVCPGSRHPALFADELETAPVSWVAACPPPGLLLAAAAGGEGGGSSWRCEYRCRYRQALGWCRLQLRGDGGVHVEFEHPQRAATPGQVIAFYDGPVCLGGAAIVSVGPSRHSRNLPVPPLHYL